MIYFDNAATTKYKPKEVLDAAMGYITEIGVSPGRGSYQLGIEASRLLYKARCSVGSYFDVHEKDHVVFTKNSTEAINLFFRGFLHKGDHVVISCYEHNAVLRPLHRLMLDGFITYDVIARDDMMLSPSEVFSRYAKPNTRLLVLTLASNLTGRLVFNESLAAFFKQNGVFTFVDSSQGAGKISLSMTNQHIDYLAFTGHKDLLALPGVGGLCCNATESISPLIQGGTGLYGDSYINPDVFPEGLEAGTLNMPAIMSLKSSIDFIKSNHELIADKENKLIKYLLDQLMTLPNVILYDSEFSRVPTCCFNVKGVNSDQVVLKLDSNGICVRGGIHCAILAHNAIGTVQTGAVRLSLNYNNSFEEIDNLLNCLGDF